LVLRLCPILEGSASANDRSELLGTFFLFVCIYLEIGEYLVEYELVPLEDELVLVVYQLSDTRVDILQDFKEAEHTVACPSLGSQFPF